MTPREKAEEILNKFDLPTGLLRIERKQCALIAVDLVLEYEDMPSGNKKYWQEVKNEIDKL